jgi:hypothetical protein
MARLGIITGMLFEQGVLNAAARNVPAEQRPLILCCGLGRGAARKAAEEAVANGATALLSFGISAGLDPRLLPGAVVTASYIHDGTKALLSDAAWTERLHAELGRLCRVTRDPIAHAHDVLMTPAEKAKALTQTGAAVADMESYAVAEAAAGGRHRPRYAARRRADVDHARRRRRSGEINPGRDHASGADSRAGSAGAPDSDCASGNAAFSRLWPSAALLHVRTRSAS